MNKDKEKIVLGSGDLYITEFDPSSVSELPAHDVIETAENKAGEIQGGAELEYASEFYTAKSDNGKATKTIMTNEDVKLKSGIMTWYGKTLQKLCATARISDNKATGKRTVKIGGIDNQDGKKYLIRFVHKDKNDGDIRLTIVGTNQSGFKMTFAKDKETVIDAEFVGEPMDNEGTLIVYEEDIPVEPEPTQE